MREEAVVPILVILVGGLSPSCSLLLTEWKSTAILNTSWAGALTHDRNSSSTATFLAIRTAPGINGVISCGLLCTHEYSCLFSIFAEYFLPQFSIPKWQKFPRVLWSANRNRMVQRNATVEFGGDGNLVLRDVDGSLVWATNTSNKGVITMNLTNSSNLMLLDSNKNILWQSFDHPTDVLVPGQEFKRGMRLIADRDKYGDHSEGNFGLEIQKNQLVLYAFGSPQQPYWIEDTIHDGAPVVVYTSRSLEIWSLSGNEYAFPTNTEAFHYLKLQPDGNIQVVAMLETHWVVVFDYYHDYIHLCGGGVGVCGTYGLCIDSHCSCPEVSSATTEGNTFSYIDKSKPELGCKPSIPLLNETSSQQMVELKNVNYYAANKWLNGQIVPNTSSSAECKHICLFNPLCKIAVFVSSTGSCYSFDRVYTFTALQNNKSPVTEVFIKMQKTKEILEVARGMLPSHEGALSPPPLLKKVTEGRKWVTPLIISSSITGFFLLVFGVYFLLRVRRLVDANTVQKSISAGFGNQFTYRELQTCTKNFSKTLGQGGFGTVFHGVMSDGMSVAVKKLESAKQAQEQFEAEVCTIGNIHHMNLLKLHGFCAEGDHRLLVYEFMPNGSLAKWIFDDGGAKKLLDWATRFSIILGTAKGLAYLHEECQERIIHLDIKPQNILLDGKFVAKVSDFGLSKLVDKDQSEIMTRMRGTPGYLAPEWLHSKITAKADVYSYGIVLLEIVCGRKCIDYECEDEDRAYLPAWVNRHVSRGNAVEAIDGCLKGAFNCEEATRALNVGLWCIQDGASVRPSMTNVVEMLKGISSAANPPIVHSNQLSKAFCEFVKSLSV